HQWWPAPDKQTLLLTVDDHSRKLLGGVFVPTDTTWHHFQHFRRTFTAHGLPLALYTDGLALFGHQSTTDGRDPRSEFQRALTALGTTHLVAPSPQAKGKIERRFGTFQKRLLALLAYEKVTAYAPAQELLAHELALRIGRSAAPPACLRMRLALRRRLSSASCCGHVPIA